MTQIEYLGLGLNETDLVNSLEFRSILENNPSLQLVTEADAEDDAWFKEIHLPLEKGGNHYVGIIDRDSNDNFMWVLYDDCAEVEDPSPALIEILKLMDSHIIRTYNERLFTPQDIDIEPDDPSLLAAKFDFTAGDYILE